MGEEMMDGSAVAEVLALVVVWVVVEQEAGSQVRQLAEKAEARETGAVVAGPVALGVVIRIWKRNLARWAVALAVVEAEAAEGPEVSVPQVPVLGMMEMLVPTFSYSGTSQKNLPALQTKTYPQLPYYADSFASLRERLILPWVSISITFTGIVSSILTISCTFCTRWGASWEI